MTRKELYRMYDIKLELLQESRLERDLMFDLWKFYIDNGIAKANRYTKQLDKLHQKIFDLNDELALIRVKLREFN